MEGTSKKFTTEKVLLMMRNRKHADGRKFFNLAEFITDNQIRSLFSRMSQQQRAIRLQASKATGKEQCRIHAVSNDYVEFVEINESMDVVENYCKLKMNGFLYVSLACERKKSFPPP